jgi:hypothetical protein
MIRVLTLAGPETVAIATRHTNNRRYGLIATMQ